MKSNIIKLLFTLLITVWTTSTTLAQELIHLPYENPKHIDWKGKERAFYYKAWGTDVITNISVPTLEVYQPEKPNGTAVIVVPGGGLMANSITSEGREVADWLTKKGITAFVLKYRLVPTTKEGVEEVNQYRHKDPVLFSQMLNEVLPYAIRDAFEALKYVRKNAEKYHIFTDKLGIVGFSAGGAISMGTSYYYVKEQNNRPDFVVNVYPWTEVMPIRFPRKDAPPMLVVCAENDPLHLAPGSVNLYNSWVNNGHQAAMHMYSKGGHGFGMRKKGLASDRWIERFYEWMLDESWVVVE